MVNNIKNNKISEISAKTSLNTSNEIKNAEIIKHKKRTSGQKELLYLFRDLSDAILTEKTLKSKSQEEENENKNENDETLMSSKDESENESENGNENRNENENKNKNYKTMSSEDENKNAKNKRNSTNNKKATNENKDENKNVLLEYMEDIDDKLFKKYSDGKDFNSFINEFDRTTIEEDKEKVVKKLKEINSFVEHYAQM